MVSNLWNSSFKLPVFICCYTRQSLSIPSFKSVLLLPFESSPVFQNPLEHLTADLYWITQPPQHRLFNSTIPCSSQSTNPSHFYQLEATLISKARSLLQQLQALLKSSKYFTLLVFWLQSIITNVFFKKKYHQAIQTTPCICFVLFTLLTLELLPILSNEIYEVCNLGFSWLFFKGFLSRDAFNTGKLLTTMESHQQPAQEFQFHKQFTGI